MQNWTYTEREKGTEILPEVPRPAEVPVFTVTDFPLRDRKRVYLANGVIGLRLPAVPFLKADVAVSGLVGRSIADGMESAAPAPYPCQAAIRIMTTQRLGFRLKPVLRTPIFWVFRCL